MHQRQARSAVVERRRDIGDSQQMGSEGERPLRAVEGEDTFEPNLDTLDDRQLVADILNFDETVFNLDELEDNRHEGSPSNIDAAEMYDPNLDALDDRQIAETLLNFDETLFGLEAHDAPPDDADSEDMFDPNLADLDDGAVTALDEDVRQYYRIDTHKTRKVGRFKAEATDYRIVVRPLDRLLRHHGAYDVVHALLESIFTRMREGV